MESSISTEHQAAKEDPVRLKVWVNTKLAETWEERDGERMDETALMTRREQYGPAIPAEVAVLTCGVDVQDDRLGLCAWLEGRWRRSTQVQLNWAMQRKADC